MKYKTLIAAACSLLSAAPVFATTINFDDVAITGTDLGSHYAGVTFGANEQVLAGTANFPAHSGTQVLGSVNPNNPTIWFSFSPAQSFFSFYYTSQDGFTGNVYQGGKKIDSFSGVAGLGVDNFFSLNTGSADVITVILSDTLHRGCGPTTIDDLSFGVSLNQDRVTHAPDNAGTLGLLAFAGIGLGAFHRKLAVR